MKTKAYMIVEFILTRILPRIIAIVTLLLIMLCIVSYVAARQVVY